MREPHQSPLVEVKTWIGGLGTVAATVLAVVCWRAGTTTSDFGPIMNGAPPFESTYYDGLWISGGGLSILFAGLMAIDVVRRVRVGFVASRQPSYG